MPDPPPPCLGPAERPITDTRQPPPAVRPICPPYRGSVWPRYGRDIARPAPTASGPVRPSPSSRTSVIRSECRWPWSPTGEQGRWRYDHASSRFGQAGLRASDLNAEVGLSVRLALRDRMMADRPVGD